MLDFFGVVFVSVVVSVDIVAILTTVNTTLVWRLIAASAAGLWLGLVVVAGLMGMLQVQGARLVLFSVPVAAFLVCIAAAPARRALLAIPAPVLIGVNAARVFGFLFLLLQGAGRLSGPFPEFAGWGDILTGALAIPAAWLAMQPTPANLKWIVAWNVLGLLDLVNAVSLALLSTNGSAFQLIHAGAGAQAMATLPWALAPTFLVPFYLITHLLVFAQTRSANIELHQAFTP